MAPRHMLSLHSLTSGWFFEPWTPHGVAIRFGPVSLDFRCLEQREQGDAIWPGSEVAPPEKGFRHKYVEGWVTIKPSSFEPGIWSYYPILTPEQAIELNGGNVLCRFGSLITDGVLRLYLITVGYPLIPRTESSISTVSWSDILIPLDSDPTAAPSIVHDSVTLGSFGKDGPSVSALSSLERIPSDNWVELTIAGSDPLNQMVSLQEEIPCITDFLCDARDHPPMDEKQGSRCVYDAFESMKINDINGLETLKDLTALKGYLPPVGPIKNIRAALLMLARVHLWYRYVWKTGILDVKSLHRLIRLLKNNPFLSLLQKEDIIGRSHHSDRVVGPTGDPWTVAYRAKVRIRWIADGLIGLHDKLVMLGFAPSLAEFWDLIPFSFVADWCVPVSDALRRFEVTDILSSHRLMHCTTSYRGECAITRSYDKGAWSFRINARAVYYEREVVLTLPPHPEWSWTDPSKNTLTGTALLVSQIASRTPRP